MSGFTQIVYEVADGIATITLNRPEKLNAFTRTMMAELIEAFDLSDADDAVRCVIVTGHGDLVDDLGEGGGHPIAAPSGSRRRGGRPRR